MLDFKITNIRLSTFCKNTIILLLHNHVFSVCIVAFVGKFQIGSILHSHLCMFSWYIGHFSVYFLGILGILSMPFYTSNFKRWLSFCKFLWLRFCKEAKKNVKIIFKRDGCVIIKLTNTKSLPSLIFIAEQHRQVSEYMQRGISIYINS